MCGKKKYETALLNVEINKTMQRNFHSPCSYVHESQWQMTKGKKLVHVFKPATYILTSIHAMFQKKSPGVNKTLLNSDSNDTVYFFEKFLHLYSLLFRKRNLEKLVDLAKKYNLKLKTFKKVLVKL